MTDALWQAAYAQLDIYDISWVTHLKFQGEHIASTYVDGPHHVVILKRHDGTLSVDRLNDYLQVRQYVTTNLGYCILGIWDELAEAPAHDAQ